MATKDINLNALQQEATLLQFAGQVQDIAKAILASKAQAEENRTASTETSSTVAEQVRRYAADTAAAGIPAKDAGDLLRTGLMRMEFPKGTALNYGRAVEGFRKLAEVQPDDWKKASVRDAQKAMESDETKELNALRAEINKYVRSGTPDQLRELLEVCKASGIVVKERQTRSDKALPVQDVTEQVKAEREQDQPAQLANAA